MMTMDFFKALGLLGFFTIFYLLSIRETPIYDETEGQYASAVREMKSITDLPKNNGVPRLQKPPLTYWTMKLSEKVIGDPELAMRLPYVLALLGLLVVTCAIGCEVMDSTRGCAAMALLGSMLGLFVFGRMIMPEVGLALCVACTFWAAVRALKSFSHESRRFWWTVAWVMMSLGCMVKGFHGAVWPLLILGLAKARGIFPEDHWRGFFMRRNWVLFLLVTLPWYFYVEIRYPGFIRENIWNEQFGHALDFRDPPTYSRIPLGLFLVEQVILLFPAVLLLPHAWKSCESTRDTFQQRRLKRLFGCIIGVVCVTSCFSARQDYYPMSCWFAVALLAVGGLDQKSASGWLLFPFTVLGLLGAGLLGFSWWGTMKEVDSFRSDTSDYFLSILMNLPEGMKPLLVKSGAGLVLGSVIGWILWRKRQVEWLPFALLLAMVMPLWGASQGFRLMSDSFSLKKLALYLNQQSTQTVVVDGPHQLSSSLLYYRGGPIEFVRANPKAEFAVRIHGIGREHYWSEEEFISRWGSGEPLAFILHEKDRTFWREKLGERWNEVPEARSGERFLVLNHP